MIDRYVEHAIDLHAENWQLRGRLIEADVRYNLLLTQFQLLQERLVSAETDQATKQLGKRTAPDFPPSKP